MRQTFKQFWPHLLSAGIALGAWDTPIIKPFRVFMVLVHEMGHAGSAILTGGEVTEMRTHWNESGHTLTRGGITTVISSAGYVGSAFLGAFLIYMGSWPVWQRVLLGGVGVFTFHMSVLYTPTQTFDFAFGVLCGAALLLIAIRFRRFAFAVATWLGVMLCLYSLYDFRTDLWTDPGGTDAGILAGYWGLLSLAYPIAFLWSAASLFLMFWALRSVDQRSRRVGAGRQTP